MEIHTCDNFFIYDKIIPYAIICMKIGNTNNESLFGVGDDGNVKISVHLQDATLETSGVFTHNETVSIDI